MCVVYSLILKNKKYNFLIKKSMESMMYMSYVMYMYVHQDCLRDQMSQIG